MPVEQFRPPSIHSHPSRQQSTTPMLDERSYLTTLGYGISRPSSTSTQSSNQYLENNYQSRSFSHGAVQLPALSALASLAASAPAAITNSDRYVQYLRKSMMVEHIEKQQALSGLEFARRVSGLRAPVASRSPKEPTLSCFDRHCATLTDVCNRSSNSAQSMSQPTYAPAATAGGQQNGPVSTPPNLSIPLS